MRISMVTKDIIPYKILNAVYDGNLKNSERMKSCLGVNSNLEWRQIDFFFLQPPVLHQLC